MTLTHTVNHSGVKALEMNSERQIALRYYQIIFLPRGMFLNKTGHVGLNTLLLWVCLFSSHSESPRGTNDMLACFSHYSEQLRTEKEQLCRWFLQKYTVNFKEIFRDYFNPAN